MICAETMFGLDFPPSDLLEVNPHLFLGWLNQADAIIAEQAIKGNPHVANAKQLSINMRVALKRLTYLASNKRKNEMMYSGLLIEGNDEQLNKEFGELLSNAQCD